MWEYHTRLCALFLFLAIPIAIADFVLLKDKGGGWISLDFRGILTGGYMIIVFLHIVISTLTLKYTSWQSVGMVHGLSVIVSIGLFCAGVYGYFGWQKSRDRAQYEATRAIRSKLFHVLTLNEWWYSPEPKNATEISVLVSVSESGRFSCNASGYGEGEYGEMHFHSDNVKQRKVEKGEHFTHTIPITWVKAGEPAKVEITLYLFADNTGSAGQNVIKVYTPQPTREDDGHNFYDLLPLPNQDKGNVKDSDN
jgi:hypothetical protein